MDYGPHTALVEVVIESIARSRILRPTAPVDAHGGLEVRDVETAKQYAWSRPIAGHESATAE